MKPGSWMVMLALGGSLAAGRTGSAQNSEIVRRGLTSRDLDRAVAGMPRGLTLDRNQASDRSRVRQVAGDEVIIYEAGKEGRTYHLTDVDDTYVTVVDTKGGGNNSLRIAWTDIDEIKRWVGGRSIVGAVVGAAGGLFLGLKIGLRNEDRECGTHCSGKTLGILSWVVGTPVAGGFLGYRFLGGDRTLTTIYARR